jgi:hypothetical protein
LQLISTTPRNTREKPFFSITGPAFNCNKEDSCFDVNAEQYTSEYKTDKASSALPVRGLFNSSKYSNLTKKPLPYNGTFVGFDGFLDDIETDTEGHPTLFNFSVDNITFLGKSMSPNVGQMAPGMLRILNIPTQHF